MHQRIADRWTHNNLVPREIGSACRNQGQRTGICEDLRPRGRRIGKNVLVRISVGNKYLCSTWLGFNPEVPGECEENTLVKVPIEFSRTGFM